ncbi:MAG TPA: DUF3343 domain-containing protein [Firmicutes bacterium]|jgi:hypothetical protein|nr:DUF3343 domain-containing protein [Bacillota bacterium]
MPKEYCLLTFASTHAALRSEKVLRQEQVPFLLVPIPREISAGCGLVLRVRCNQVQKVQEILAAIGVTPGGVYPDMGGGAGSLLDKFHLEDGADR